MTFELTVQVSENTRATLSVPVEDLVSAVTRPEGGTHIRVAGGQEHDVLEAVSDIRLQCEVLGVEVPAGVGE